jgi:hypothetical protein
MYQMDLLGMKIFTEKLELILNRNTDDLHVQVPSNCICVIAEAEVSFIVVLPSSHSVCCRTRSCWSRPT